MSTTTVYSGEKSWTYDIGQGISLVKELTNDSGYDNDVPGILTPDDDDDEEDGPSSGTKALERVQNLKAHVRTEEGARRFGLPIGALIVRDRLAAGLTRHRGINAAIPDGYQGVEGQGYTLKKRFGGYFRVESYIAQQRDLDDGSTYFEVMTYKRDRGSLTRIDIAKGFDTLQDAADHSARVAKETEAKRPQGKKDPVARARVDGNFFDNYPGVRGWDWDEKDIDWDDERARKRLAKKDFDELGIEAQGSWHPDFLESIGAAIHGYEDIFPGIHYYIKSFTSGGKGIPPHFFAWNQNMPNSISQYADGQTDRRGYDTSQIGLRRSIASGADDGTLVRGAITSDKSGWWSIRFDEMQKANPDLEDWRLAFFGTFNHEVGHTMARVAMGQLSGEQSYTYPDDPYPQNKKADERAVKFADGIQQIFSDMGLKMNKLERHEKLTLTSRQVSSDQVLPFGSSGIDPAEVSGVLSEYGSKSLHEMLAESWAEYMTDPEPRAFAREVGGLMEDMFNEFLADEGLI